MSSRDYDQTMSVWQASCHMTSPERMHTCRKYRDGLQEGDATHVFSRSAKAWVDAEVVDLLEDRLVRVEYEVGDYLIGKTLHLQSDYLATPSATGHCLAESDRMGQWPMSLSPATPQKRTKSRAHSFLAAYFCDEYRKGMPVDSEVLRHDGYTQRFDRVANQYVFHHPSTGIRVWRFALDFSSPHRPSSHCRIAFHYTSPQAFMTITNVGNAALTIFRSLKQGGDAFFGEGVYATELAPHQFGSKEAVLCNNFGFNVFIDPELQNQKRCCAAFCLPIIVNAEDFVNVRFETTPEMKKVGTDRLNNLLNDFERDERRFMQIQDEKIKEKVAGVLSDGRDVIVLRLQGEQKVAQAKDALEAIVQKCVRFDPEMRLFLGVVYFRRAKHEDALKEYSAALQIKIATFGPDHPQVATTRHEMGNVYLAQSNYEDALKEYSAALQIKIATFGRDHLEVATTRHEIGNVYLAQSKYEDALKEYSAALQIKIATLVPDHPEVATTRHAIGNVYRAQSKYEDALKEYSAALQIDIATFGPDHPEIATTRHAIGDVYQLQSNYKDALKEYSAALQIDIATFGPDHPDVASTRYAIGNVYRAQSKYEDALKEYSAALQIFIATFGPDHPQVATTRHAMEKIQQAAAYSELPRGAAAFRGR